MKKIQIWIVLLLFLALSSLMCIPILGVYARSGPGSLHVKDVPNLQVVKNSNVNISLETNASGNLGKVPLDFSVVKGPLYGTLNSLIEHNGKTSASVIYTPKYNYTGPDSFTFKAITVKMNQTSNTGNVSIIVKPKPFIESPEYRAALAFGVALIVDVSIFLGAFAIIRGIRARRGTKITIKFWDIIRDDNWYPSLAIFQFVMWTGIVIFAYLGIALTRLFSGFGVPMEIPYTLLLVMGISAGTTVTSAGVSSFKYNGTTPTDVEPTKEFPSDKVRKKLPGYRTMLMENEKITLTRFQMFAWTWIGIIAYLGLLFWEVNGNLSYFERLSVPGLPILLVSLMGLSQGTYLTGKSVKSSFLSINEVRPGKISLQAEKNLITILGSNFGNTGSVWLEYYLPINDEDMQNRPYLSDKERKRIIKKEQKRINNLPPDKKPMDGDKVQALLNEVVDRSEKELVDEWKKQYRYSSERFGYSYDITKTAATNPSLIRLDNRIVVSLDDIWKKLNSDEYVVRVEKDGLLTYANSDATFEIQNIPPIAEDQSYSTEENKAVEITLKATDPDTADQLTYIKVSDPLQGTLGSVETNTGKVTYTPNKDYAGPDSFTFKANDGKVDGSIGKVNINVKK